MRKILLLALVSFYAQARLIDRIPLVAFFIEAIHKMDQVGALVPTSNIVAQECMRYIKEHQGPKKILEIGAGIGNITQIIKKHLKADDILDVVEVDPAYCKILQEKFKNDPRIRIHCVDILTFDPGYTYDYVVSTLPHTCLSPEFVANMIAKYKSLLVAGGRMSYVEYIGFTKITSIKKWGHEKVLYYQKLILLRAFQRAYKKKTVMIFRNIPPIFVHHLQMD